MAMLSPIGAKHLGLAHHPVIIERDHFGRHRAGDDLGNLPHHLEEVAARLVDQDGVGRHPVEQAGLGKLADFGNFGGVGKELHRRPLADRCSAGNSRLQSAAVIRFEEGLG